MTITSVIDTIIAIETSCDNCGEALHTRFYINKDRELRMFIEPCTCCPNREDIEAYWDKVRARKTECDLLAMKDWF